MEYYQPYVCKDNDIVTATTCNRGEIQLSLRVLCEFTPSPLFPLKRSLGEDQTPAGSRRCPECTSKLHFVPSSCRLAEDPGRLKTPTILISDLCRFINRHTMHIISLKDLQKCKKKPSFLVNCSITPRYVVSQYVLSSRAAVHQAALVLFSRLSSRTLPDGDVCRTHNSIDATVIITPTTRSAHVFAAEAVGRGGWNACYGWTGRSSYSTDPHGRGCLCIRSIAAEAFAGGV